MSATLKTIQIGMESEPGRLGGLDRYFYSLLPELPLIDIMPHGLVVGRQQITSEIPNVDAFAENDDSLSMRFWKLRSTLRALLSQNDVLVTHFAPYLMGCLDLLEQLPLVVHFHGPWALESAAEGAGKLATLLKRQIEKLVYRRGSRFIVLSQSFRDLAVRDYGIPFDRISVVPGGVDVDRFTSQIGRSDARALLGWNAKRPTVVTVRRLVRAKGVDNLILATRELKRRIPNVFVAIVGTGPMAGELERLIIQNELQDTVRMVGHVSEADLPTIYRAADLFVVPTVTLEGFGLVVIEALAAGTPTLVTPIGGLPEVVNDLDPGLVLPGWSPPELAEGIGAALADPSLMPGELECAAYATRFRWSQVARRVGEIYREAL